MNSSSGKLSPSRAYTMKDLEQQISELKKENFSLKLRIYYMEEKIQQKYEDDDDIKTNIELKVEAESLKKELMDKQQLLGKASQAVESLAVEKEQLLKKREKEQDVNLKHLQEKYEEKLRDKEEENKYLKELQDDLQSQLEKAQELQQELEREVQIQADEKELASESSKESIGEKDRVIDQLQSALQTKEEVISRLMEEKQQTSEGTLQPLRKDNDKLRKELAEKEKEVEDLKRELEDELTEEKRNAEERIEKQNDGNLKKIKQLEETLEKAKEELAGKDDDMKDLENDLRSAQNAEKEAAKELNMAKNEIQSLKSNTLKRDKAIQGFVQAMRGKEKEDLEQYQSSVSDIQTNVADLKADLHAKQLENEGLQKTNARKQQEIDRLRNEKIQGEADNQKSLGEKEADIQDLQHQVQEARDRAARETGDMKDHYEDLLDDCKKDLDKKDKLIQKLNKTLQEKDEIIQEQSRDADSALDDLKKRLKEKEKRLEGKVEEQILATEAAEAEAGDLRKLLKEKETDLEQLHRANLDQKQKLKLKGAGDQNKQLTEALNLQSRSKEVQDEGLKRSLGEKEAIISNLQKSIAEKDGMLENLRDLLEGQARGETAKEDLFKQLTAKLRDKEKQLQEMVAERADVANANQKATQDLLDALRDKDEQIKDLNGNLGKQMSQHSNKIRNLQRELDNKDLELQGAGDALNRAEREQENLVGKLRNALEEKDKTIEKLLDSGREKDKLFVEMQQAVAKNHPSLVKAAEIQRLKDEADGLRESLSGKEDEVRRLKSSLPEKGELDSLRAELQNKNKLLERAKATIDQLQQPEVSKYEMARQKRRLTELEAKLEAKEQELDAKMEDEKAKDRLIKELQIRVNLADNRKGRGSSNDDLHDALREQIKELSRLTDTLKAERQLYVNITQSGTKDESDSSRTRLLDSELAAVQALRRQLENGLHSRDDIRISIDGRPYFSSNTSGVGSDVHESSYGPSSREQNSRDLQTREAQAGRVEDTSSLVSEPLVKRQYVNVMDMSIPEMREELLDLRNQLDRSARQEEVSEERVRREDLESLRSIPGQEDDTTDKNNDALKQRVDSLEAQLQRREQEAVSLNQQLEAALFNQSRDGAGSNSHVIPILKQQLDQAKTLLRRRTQRARERTRMQRMKRGRRATGIPHRSAPPCNRRMRGWDSSRRI
ncbi:putative centrosome-associated protein [Apostichopus japonicus]|uniref:Putative centrosome-associated protein n=1 Tax=Stichopus japonicus TaxID=307972 RepID=A0A2G8LRS6_STIJA|nr:putative centrosome-associated protein [Apostichopus japonicus]